MLELEKIAVFLELVATELGIETNHLNVTTPFRTLDSWSSLNALILISRIMEESDVLISASDLASCVTLGDIHDLIVTRKNGIV